MALFAGRSQIIASHGSNEWWDQSWESGIFKEAVSCPVWLSYGGIQGDEQADRKYHGGVDKALCAYPAAHYDYWRRQKGLMDIPFGGFGENITLGEATEAQLCIGDRFKFNDAIVEVSQPRQPCWKLSRRWRVEDLKEQTEQTGFTGFYFRVAKHGWLASGDVGTLIERPCPQWNLAECNEIMHKHLKDHAAAQRLAECVHLSGSWKDTLFARANGLDYKC
jgi:MOSC domain-containing protein YiiM